MGGSYREALGSCVAANRCRDRCGDAEYRLVGLAGLEASVLNGFNELMCWDVSVFNDGAVVLQIDFRLLNAFNAL